ncbi:LysR family transcriptional regulator [Vibrio ostreicida]|uniref:LysR family transcriptional regulator n=1 Tax=Vibrio ostreicida TaxID=526588 RepID=UPI00097087E9|nr:LysR family transcriptional regulator [Vibrio ostreicida]
MLNFQWLQTFQTLIETGHFTKTAQTLYMTQPGVSQHIQKLEKACGQPLITRHNKTFDITDAGKSVYQYAKQVQSQQTELLCSLTGDDPYNGPVSLSCSGSLALGLYPHLIDLQCKYKGLIPSVEAAPQHKIIADILNDSTDIGIVTQAPSDSRFDVKPLGKEVLCLLVPKFYNQGALTKERLVSLGLIRHPDVDHYLSFYFSKCGEPPLESLNISDLPTKGYVNQLSQILLPVAKGVGFTVLPKSALACFPDKRDIDIYQPNNDVAETLYFVTKRHRKLPKRTVTITETIIRYFYSD